MPGEMGPLLRKRAMRLSRISSLTRRLRTRCSGNCELLRSSPRVCGSLLKGWIPPGSRPPSSHCGPNDDECSYSTPAMLVPARDEGGDLPGLGEWVAAEEVTAELDRCAR